MTADSQAMADELGFSDSQRFASSEHQLFFQAESIGINSGR